MGDLFCIFFQTKMKQNSQIASIAYVGWWWTVTFDGLMCTGSGEGGSARQSDW
jgi:hypothetical protein